MPNENTPPATPPTGGTPPATPPSGLPSDNPEIDLSGFNITDDIKAKFKDGKLYGRFASMDEVLKHLKDAEDFKANTIREQTEATKTQAQQQATIQAQQEAIASMLPDFMQNNMQLTPEMETKAAEAGIDIRDLKLGALELRDRVAAAHSIVGGKEEYEAMLAWGKENMNDAQKAAFDKDVIGDMSEYAIKGLYADYQKAAAGGEDTERFEGSTTIIGIKPYATRKELYADKEYVESPRGRRDTAARKQYEARKRITPDEVLFGR